MSFKTELPILGIDCSSVNRSTHSPVVYTKIEYLRMDGSGLVSPQLHGGGKVNCRFGIDDGEKELSISQGGGA